MNKRPSKRERLRRERAERKALSDELAKDVKPGAWVRFRDHGYMRLIGKIGRVLDWADDGYNDQRAPRNIRIAVQVEPHLDGEIITSIRAGYMEAICPLVVLAEASE